MSFAREVKRRVRSAISPLVLLAVAGYFAWSATQGDHGLPMYARQQDQLRLAKAELARVEVERAVWERRVIGLHTARLDPDSLDERARSALSVADPSDIVVMYPPAKKLF